MYERTKDKIDKWFKPCVRCWCDAVGSAVLVSVLNETLVRIGFIPCEIET